MKSFICTVIYCILVIGGTILFTLNDFGLTSWQFQAFIGGTFAAYTLGVVVGADYEEIRK